MLLVFILHTYAVDGLHCCTKTTSKMSLSLHFTKGTILVYTLKRSTTIIDIVVCLVVCQGYFVELSGGFMTLVSWFWGYVFHGVPQCFFKWDTAIVWQCEDLSLNRLTSCASCWDHWIWRGSSDSPIDPCFCQSAPFLRLQPERARLQRTSRTRTLASTSLDVGGAWSDSRSRVYHKLVPLLTTQLTTWAPRKKKKKRTFDRIRSDWTMERSWTTMRILFLCALFSTEQNQRFYWKKTISAAALKTNR